MYDWLQVVTAVTAMENTGHHSKLIVFQLCSGAYAAAFSVPTICRGIGAKP